MTSRDHAYRTAMWIFLASEALLFAGLFALYAAYRAEYPDDFAAAAERSVGVAGAANTIVLLVSSFFVASAIESVRHGQVRAAAGALVLVVVLGAVFLAIKLLEWRAHLGEGLAPGAAYDNAALPGRGAALFFTLYYLMTGLHGLHVVIGMLIVAWLILGLGAGRITRQRHLVLELGGLYWHFVDVIWLFLWPLFYLVR
jgi:cytochrome c oxidase subunit III